MTKIILYAIMFAAFFGMLWANNQYKGKGVPWGRPLAAVFGIFSLLMALTTIMMQLVGGGFDQGKVDEYRKKEARYQFIAHKKLGQLIAEKNPGAKILLIKYEEYDFGGGNSENVVGTAIMDGLKEGLAGAAEITTEEEVSSGMEMEMMYDEASGEMPSEEDMMEKMLTSEKFNKLVKTNRECKVIISLAGLPMDYQLMEFWRMKDAKKRPALYLVNAQVYDLKGPIRAKFVNGVLMDKPVPVDIEQDVPEDETVAFDSRFLLVTPENVVNIASEFSNLFADDKK